MTEMQTLTIGTQTYVLVDGKAIHFNAPQALSPEEKAQTLGNIGAAPAGYGLGVQKVNYVTSLALLDTIIENGWYVVHLKNDGEHISGASAGLLCVNACQLSAEQTFLYYGSSWRLTRTWHNATSTWSEWEWINPPMKLGQEYRTTERWKNKPVYTKLINCGMLPAVGSTASVTIKASKNITQTIRAEGQLISSSVGGGDSLPFYNPVYGDIRVGASKYEVKVNVLSWNGTVPSLEAYIRVWYVFD